MHRERADQDSPYWLIAAVITVLLFVDGFDLFLLGKIAPAIAAGYGRPPEDMALVFTWHQIGLAVGAFVIPSLADRFGAKRALITLTALFGLGSFASAMAPDLVSFAAIRCFCGVFMAAALPIGLSLLSERVPPARLGTVLSLAMVGMSAGSAASNIAAAWLLDLYGWRSGLIVGGVLPLMVLPLLVWCVPEAKRFVGAASRSARDGLMRQLSRLFLDRRAFITLLLWTACFLNMGHIALVAAWLPTYFQELGGVRIQDFAAVAMLTLVGGAAGTVAVGWLQDRMGPITTTMVMHVGNGLGLALLGVVPFGTFAFAALFTAWSFFQSASIAGISLLGVRFYPIEIRATGSGWAAGVGRIGGAFAPTAGAMLLTTGIGLSAAMFWAATPMLAIALIIIPLMAAAQRQVASTAPADAAHAPS